MSDRAPFHSKNYFLKENKQIVCLSPRSLFSFWKMVYNPYTNFPISIFVRNHRLSVVSFLLVWTNCQVVQLFHSLAFVLSMLLCSFPQAVFVQGPIDGRVIDTTFKMGDLLTKVGDKLRKQ